MDVGFLNGSGLDLGHEFRVIPNLALFVGAWVLLDEEHESHEYQKKKGDCFKVLVQGKLLFQR
jgi:hypothetical protein